MQFLMQKSTAWGKNNYFIIKTKTGQLLVIDPPADIEQSYPLLQQNTSQTLTIFLTHRHHDHVEGLPFLQQHFNCHLYVAQPEWQRWLKEGRQPTIAVTTFENEQSYQFTDVQIKCLLTPGHTVGSSCFVINDQYLLTGDTLFVEGCGLCGDYVQANQEMFASLQRIKSLSSDLLVYPGHTYRRQPGCSLQYIKERNIYLRFKTLSQFVNFRERPNQKHLLKFK